MGLFSRKHAGVTPQRARQMQGEGAVLVDVREPSEWSAGRAPGAVHVPLGQLASRLAEIPRDVTVVTVCRSGRRSDTAAAQLRAAGYTVHNLDGGMQAWQAAGLPVVRVRGEAGRVV
jgi:rhodanese-related sulfurtransferase